MRRILCRVIDRNVPLSIASDGTGQWCLWILLTLCFGFGPWFTTAAHGQSAQQQQFIVDLYQAYFQRTPGVSEISEWVGWFQRGSSAEEIHASFISSEEFFNRIGRDQDRFITNAYRLVTGADPTVPQFQYWKQRLMAQRLDRRKWALELLRSVGDRRPGLPPVATAPTLEPLARQLATQARQLQAAVNREYSGNVTVLRMQVTSLMTATAQLQSATSLGQSGQISRSYQDVQAALTGVLASLRNQPGGFNSQIIAGQMGRTLQLMAQQFPGGNRPGNQPGFPGTILPPVQPPIGIPGGNWSPQQWQQLNWLTSELEQEVNSLYFLLRNLSQQDYRYQALVNDMQWYSGQVSQFQNSLNGSVNVRNLQRQLQTLQQYSTQFQQRIQGESVDFRLRQGLLKVEQGLSQIATLIGGGGNFPGFQPLPEVPNRQELINELSLAIAQCDRLIAYYSGYVLYGRPVQVYLAQLRSTRQQLVVLRQSLLGDAVPLQLENDIQSVIAGIGNLQQPWQEMGRVVPRVDPSEMNALRTSATRMQRWGGRP